MYYYYEGEQLEKYKILYESLALSKQTPVEITDSIKKMYGAFNPSDLYKKYDKNTLSVDFLSYHIDWAFKVWQEQPWGKNISFDDFCEYILPYRIGDEQPEYWRECLYDQYNPLLDEFRKSTHSDDPVEAARVIIKYLCGQIFLLLLKYLLCHEPAQLLQLRGKPEHAVNSQIVLYIYAEP